MLKLKVLNAHTNELIHAERIVKRRRRRMS